MIIAGLLSGIIIGLISATIVALTGFGFVLALFAYVISGTIGMILVPAVVLWRQGSNAEPRTAEA